ncbi:MAG TPA: prepilin-type N-terminal cleavage/methylation domain-containing protein [Myxococcota bacterium]|nr:prepilin-type N-terminal cleavage/methylation domain-containing protein [Myxococcota bacterium]
MSRPRSDGFTLLEILVAVFIMAMILTFAFEAYKGIEQAYARVGASNSRDRSARIVLDRIERELVGTVMIEREKNSDPLLQPYFFFGESRPYADSEGDMLRFVTRTPLRAPGVPSPGVEIVTYGAVPAQTGPGLSLLRQAEPLPPQLAKEVVWNQPDVVADNVALFIVRYEATDVAGSEGWDSTGLDRLDQIPESLVVTVSLWETDASGQPVQGPEFTRAIDLPVRPFKIGADDGNQPADCGQGMSVKQCMDSFAGQISSASESLAQAISDAQAQVQEPCWNPQTPSPALQRLKVLMGGVPGFDASQCK